MSPVEQICFFPVCTYVTEQHKNTTSYSEQILEPAPHETSAVRPLTDYLTNHSSKTNKTC